MDDALSLVHLFALLPAKNEIRAKRTKTCQRLVREWDMYVIKSKSLRKTFISIKGIYYQAEVMGEKITWLVPHKFSQELRLLPSLRLTGSAVPADHFLGEGRDGRVSVLGEHGAAGGADGGGEEGDG